MYLLSRLFLFLTKSSEELARQRADAYLAQAVDVYDLEYRIRKLDRDAVAQRTWMTMR